MRALLYRSESWSSNSCKRRSKTVEAQPNCWKKKKKKKKKKKEKEEKKKKKKKKKKKSSKSEEAAYTIMSSEVTN